MTRNKGEVQPPQKLGSVQANFVAARAISGQMLCLVMPDGTRDFVSVLEVSGLSFDLKSEAEQVLLTDLYQGVLAALAFPVQILWRFRPLHVDDYLAFFHEVAGSGAAHPLWKHLAEAHVAFVQRLAERRTLLDRRFYLVIRSSPEAAATPLSLKRLLFPGNTARRSESELLERARQELDLRVSEVSRLLLNLGLAVQRLAGKQQLASFYSSCLMALRAEQYPLPALVIEGVDRPIQAADRVHPSTPARLKEGARSEPPLERGEDHTSSGLFTQLADLVAPAVIEVYPDCLKLQDEYARVLVVRALPRVVATGWLKPLAQLDEPLEVSLLLRPHNSAHMVSLLRRRQMEYQSSLQVAARKGAIADVDIKLAHQDVEQLIDRLASGEERMLDFSLLLLVRGRSRQELDERTERIQTVLHTMLLVAQVPRYEQAQAFRSCLPHARSQLGEGVLLDSRSASTAFPFLVTSLFQPSGILEGVTPTGELVVLDAWGETMTNANRIILGPPGVGKSYQVKAHLMRLALRYAQGSHGEKTARRFQVIVIDPEREYGRTAAALGGQIIRLAPGSEQHINPFDLPHPQAEALTPEPMTRGDRLADHIQRLHTLLEIMLADHTPSGGGRLTSEEIGLLDRALYETYRRAGITSDVATHERAAPLMQDLYAVLESGDCGPDQTGLMQRLRRYVHGSLAGMFRGPTTVGLNNSVVVFDIHDLETELRPIGLFLVSNYVWTQSFQSTIPRQLIVDEAATLYQYESGAEFLEELVRRARKHYLGVTIITQHPAIFAKSAIPSNCAVHLLMRQDVTSLDLIGQLFHLSESERQIVRRLGIGEALLTVNEKRLVVKFEASELEHLLATTNPQEIARWQRDPAHRQTLAAVQQLLALEPSSPEQPGPKRRGRQKKQAQALEALCHLATPTNETLWRADT